MMYLLFRHHSIRPSDYYEMGYGERTVLKAFMNYQIEKYNEAMKEMNKTR